MELSNTFQVITLDGFNALGFYELFESAENVLDIFPYCMVKFHFNGYLIVVNDNTKELAWEKYINKKFEKIN